MTKRMRWNVLEFLGKFTSNHNTETYRFQSIKCPPAAEELSNFENDLLLMIRHGEFRKYQFSRKTKQWYIANKKQQQSICFCQ